jgi:Dna[CI] antecedent, DciA
LSRFGGPADLAELTARWPAAVGEAIARNAWPARIGRDGTLHVNTADSVWAFELSHRAADIAGRLGVEAIKFAPGPLAVAEPPPVLRQAPVTSSGDLRAAAEIAASIGDEELRKSVEKAVSFSLARGRVDRPV